MIDPLRFVVAVVIFNNNHTSKKKTLLKFQGAKTIEALLGKAKEFIPQKFWGESPIVLKATAGLRLLPDHEAENLLNEVRDVFLRSGFLVKDDSVEILDGVDEGIYSWFTINFLLSKYLMLIP